MTSHMDRDTPKKLSRDTCEATGAHHDQFGSESMDGLDNFFGGIAHRYFFYLNIPMFFLLLSASFKNVSCLK
jgi:hypothetical protein